MQGKGFGGSGFTTPKGERLPAAKKFRPTPFTRRRKPVDHRRLSRPTDLADVENLTDAGGQDVEPAQFGRPDAVMFDELPDGLKDRPGPISSFFQRLGL